MKKQKLCDGVGAALMILISFSLAVDLVMAADLDCRVSDLSVSTNRYEQLKGLSESERESLRSTLRARVSLGDIRLESKARLVLLDMGDRVTLDETRRIYEEGSVADSFSVQHQLRRSSQPAVIQLVAPHLFRNESAEMISLSSEFFDYPLSVRSAEIIRNVLMSSPEFPECVRNWAATYSTHEADRMRNAIREWWALNKERIEQKEYGAVVPVNVANHAPTKTVER